MKMTCDVLVVGAGVGGCITASELFHHGLDVLLIEEGPQTLDQDKPAKRTTEMASRWKNGGLNVALGKPNIPYAEGACVGGGSEINTGIMQRCQDQLLSEWSTNYHIENFHLKSYYERAENMVQAEFPSHLSESSSLLKHASHSLNWRSEALKMAYRNQEKQSLAKFLISPLLKKGFRLQPNCKLIKIIFKKNRAIKAIVETNSKRTEISFNTLFLCSGAINTPFILLKNKISNHIGNSLKLHPTLRAITQFHDPINKVPAMPGYAITEFMPNMRIGESVFTPGYLSMAVAEDWENRQHLLPHLFHCGIFYTMIKPQGIGKIRCFPGMPEPIVSYSLKNEDWKLLSDAYNKLMEVMFIAGARFMTSPILGQKGYTEFKKLRELPKNQTSLLSIHLFSSCPMGENKKLCATNSYGKIHDIENIFINDASLIPDATGTNPQGTIMAIALRNCEYFLTERANM